MFERIPEPGNLQDFIGLKAYLNSLLKVLNNIFVELYKKKTFNTNVTLTVSSATTTISDTRILDGANISLTPKTASAAVEIGAGTLYVSSISKGAAVLNHVNSAVADRTYQCNIVNV